MNNTILQDNITVVYYALAVQGRIVTAKFATPSVAESARSQLPADQQSIAEVVTVDSAGRQLLLG
jgi:hypothetical protein